MEIFAGRRADQVVGGFYAQIDAQIKEEDGDGQTNGRIQKLKVKAGSAQN